MITDTRAIPQEAVKQTFFWLRQFSIDWRGEVPLKLHEGHGGLGAAPAFTAEFNDYVGYIKCSSPDCHSCRCVNSACQRCAKFRREDLSNFSDRNPAHRTRVTRAFRKLRGQSPREFDVLYLICQGGLSIPEVADRLNERSERTGRTERIDPAGVLILAMAGTDKVRNWF
jgi:hypothetical protein